MEEGRNTPAAKYLKDNFQDIRKKCLRQDRPLIVFVSKAPKERNLLALGAAQGINRNVNQSSAGAIATFENDDSMPARWNQKPLSTLQRIY
jgi:hypothetical protein